MKKIFLAQRLHTQEEDLLVKYIFNLENSHCAKYARLQAENLFNIIYPKADAWNLHNFLKKEKFKEDNLNRGDYVLCYNPKSPNLDKKDIYGRDNPGTHIALYLGEDTNRDRVFIHQYRNSQEILTLDDLISYPLKPELILKK